MWNTVAAPGGLRKRARWMEFNFLAVCGCDGVDNFRLKLHYRGNSSEEYNVVVGNVIHTNCRCVSDANIR